jgi:hypothetical protein
MLGLEVPGKLVCSVCVFWSCSSAPGVYNMQPALGLSQLCNYNIPMMWEVMKHRLGGICTGVMSRRRVTTRTACCVDECYISWGWLRQEAFETLFFKVLSRHMPDFSVRNNIRNHALGRNSTFSQIRLLELFHLFHRSALQEFPFPDDSTML